MTTDAKPQNALMAFVSTYRKQLSLVATAACIYWLAVTIGEKVGPVAMVMFLAVVGFSAYAGYQFAAGRRPQMVDAPVVETSPAAENEEVVALREALAATQAELEAEREVVAAVLDNQLDPSQFQD